MSSSHLRAIVITIEHISKQYRIGQQSNGAISLRETLSHAAARTWRGIRRMGVAGRDATWHRERPSIWALDDVNLRIEPGEVVGVIGRNGSGKSTLLKILSRITEPTKGRVEIVGRVGSLLEVGTGFHPELTGRENIYLNGAILGMSRSEVKRSFDAIVDFAGVERFLDTPIKRYSSGMYVRLGFAVAAHLEPEILLVDEVLAVGDAAFQRKCLGKMADVAGGGRTVLFVSHNMTAVGNLCHRAVWLEGGRIRSRGATHEVINAYAESLDGQSPSVPLRERHHREGNGRLRFTGFEVRAGGRGRTETIRSGEPVELVIEYEADSQQPLENVSMAIPIYNPFGQHLFMCWTRVVDRDFEQLPSRGRVTARIDAFPLPEGSYSLNLWAEVNGVLADWVKQAVVISVVGGDFFGTGRTTPRGHGGVLVPHAWSFEEEAA